MLRERGDNGYYNQDIERQDPSEDPYFDTSAQGPVINFNGNTGP